MRLSESQHSTASVNTPLSSSGSRGLLNKVPEVTIFFWIIKVLCTTVGETVSDFLNVNLGFGLTGTSFVMGSLLLLVLFFQFKSKKYIPVIYWLAVVLISIFGTLVTDNMTDSMGVPLEASTIGFCVALTITFALWYASEKTLSIHSIFTVRREVFYWLTILFTFALGTAAGDLMAESLGLGYLVTGSIVCVVIAAVSVAWKYKLDPVMAFWVAYILTRPLGASLGDYLTQPEKYGGLGLGATLTSAIFIVAILLIVVFLSVTKRDVIPATSTNTTSTPKANTVFGQVVVVVCVLAFASVSGYFWRHTQLLEEAAISVSQTTQQEVTTSTPATPQKGKVATVSKTSPQGDSTAAVAHVSPLGDLSSFIKIEEDTLRLVNAGNLAEAKSRVDDLEYTWDNAEAHLKPMNQAKWTEIDDSIDNVLRELRAVHQDAKACKAALEASLATLR